MSSSIYPEISFGKALQLLRSIDGEAFFMSEDNAYGGASYLTLHGENYTAFIAKTNAGDLAECIEFEWYESCRLAELGMYNPDFILPEDVYVFDLSMEWVIVFTHEITCDLSLEMNELMKAAESRLCIAYGISV